jgi:hypothetical protein
MAAKVAISIAEALEIVPEHELKARHGVKKGRLSLLHCHAGFGIGCARRRKPPISDAGVAQG